MSAKIKGGNQLAAKLAAIVKNAKKSDGVKVGFLEGATYPDGTNVAQVAYWQEYGATIKVEERQQTVYRSTDKSGNFLKNGRFVKKDKSNFSSSHKVAAHTITIPPRPFFRLMITKGSPRWGNELGAILGANGYDAKGAFTQMGEMMKDELTDSIVTFAAPANAKSTVAKKGFNDPLRDSGHMENSTDFEVDE